jgi:hypothetical protein
MNFKALSRKFDRKWRLDFRQTTESVIMEKGSKKREKKARSRTFRRKRKLLGGGRKIYRRQSSE